VFMDCQMPELDGFEATRLIRELEEDSGRARTPIVAMTANAMAGDRERCIEAGMDEYLAKPVHPEDLSAMLSRVLGTGAPPAATPAATPSPSPASPADIDSAPLVDMARLRDLGVVGDDGRTTLRELVNLFAVETPEMIARIGEGIDAESVHIVQHAAHNLKGSALSLGAARIGALATEIDRRAKAGTIDGADALLTSIDVAFGATVAELRSLAQGPDPAGAPRGSAPDPARGTPPNRPVAAGAARSMLAPTGGADAPGSGSAGRPSSRPVGVGTADSKGEVVA
jgi:CheY-like chemotaxis protein